MTTPPSKQALAFLDAWLDYQIRQRTIPGMSIAIAHGRDIMFTGAYGFADIDKQVLMTTQHVFSMASQSKLFASSAVMQLVGANKLCLDDPICDRLPWLQAHPDQRVRDITVRQVLSHSAGFVRDGPHADFWTLAEPFPTADELRATVLATEIVVEPNTQLKYSNMGIALIGFIVEAVSGMPYVNYVQRHIIEPLGLTGTYATYRDDLAHRLATAYSFAYEGTRRPLMPRLATNAFAPAVGIHSTPTDMCRFATAHFFGNETLLNDRLKKEIQRTQSIGHGYDAGWEFGLGLELQQAGSYRLLGHGGHLAGHLTATFFDPHAQLAVSAAVNVKEDAVDIVKIVRGIFGALDWFTEAERDSAITPRDLLRLNSRLFSPIAVIQVVAAGNRVVMIDPDDWDPFSFAEQCEYQTPGVLRITTSGSAFNEGETIRYTFSTAGSIASVNYTGQTLLPEAAWRRQVGSRSKHRRKEK